MDVPAAECTIEAEPMDDGFYYVVCQGRLSIMEDEAAAFVESKRLGAFCKLYTFEGIGDTVAFIVYCAD